MSIGFGLSGGVLGAGGSRLAVLGTKIVRSLKKGPYGKRVLIGLRRDLTVPFPAPPANIPISLRAFRPEDIKALFPVGDGLAAVRERADIEWRLRMVEHGALKSQCFVAVDETTDRPCHIQWLTEGYDNTIRDAAALPALSLDEALLENAYTPLAYRSRGILSAVTARIAEFAAESGLRYVVGFIDQHNVASLRGGQRAGLIPWQIQMQRQYAFGLLRRVRFKPVPADFRLPHERWRPVDP